MGGDRVLPALPARKAESPRAHPTACAEADRETGALAPG